MMIPYHTKPNQTKPNQTKPNRTMSKEPHIDGVRMSNVEVTYKGKPDPDELYWGAVTIKCQNREFIWDVCQSYTDDLGDGLYRTTLDIEADPEMFASSYDLTEDDLLSPDSATIYIEGVEPTRILLWFTTLEDDHYQYIDLEAE